MMFRTILKMFIPTVFATCVAVNTCAAAEIELHTTPDGVNFVILTGEIVSGDYKRFETVTSGISNAIVTLSSPGGLAFEGLAIGAMIHQKHYSTFVPETRCASVCGLIWLAGSKRFISERGAVGFHAAYNSSGVSGSTNAAVGAYLTQLGFDLHVVLYVTNAAPDDMKWLDAKDANALHIAFTVIQETKPQSKTATQEQRITNLVTSYYNLWSQPGTNVDGLTQYYADAVTFYGNATSRTKIMEEKRKFSVRWPAREYTVKTSTLFVQCSDVCSVTGVVEWDAISIERNAHSTGSANFVLKIIPNGSSIGGLIISENGSVLAWHTEPVAAEQPILNQPQASVQPDSTPVTPSYSQGRQARIDYEQWFGGLPDGSYKDGATYWAANRNDKRFKATCVNKDLGNSDQSQWQKGCLDSRQRLSTVDARRTAEPDYKLGWNSL